MLARPVARDDGLPGGSVPFVSGLAHRHLPDLWERCAMLSAALRA